MSPAVGEWLRVAAEKDLAESLRVEVAGHPVALFRLPDGVHALDDICSHEYSRLSEGEVWEGEVYCPKHGSRFDIRTGAVSGLPATLPVRSYPVKSEDGALYILWDGGR
jgi:3-phenylpropionate/trans-cinnamate dioxygenase ferredoxin component